MSDGLTPRQLRALKQDYGSLRAAAKAHPELAEQLEQLEQMGAPLRAIQEGMAPIQPLLGPIPEPEGIDADALIEQKTAGTRLQAELLGEVAALRRAFESGAVEPDPGDDDVEVDPRSNPDPHDEATFWKAVKMLLAGEDLSATARATKIHRNRVRKIRDFRAHPFRPGPNGRPGYGLYPGPIPGQVVLRKVRKTA